MSFYEEEIVEMIARAIHHTDYERWPEPNCTQCMAAGKAVSDMFDKEGLEIRWKVNK